MSIVNPLTHAIVLGSGGQLGEELLRQLPEARGMDRSGIDVTDDHRLRELIVSSRPDVVLNATSYNRVDAAETDPFPAFAVNSIAVYRLAIACREAGSRLVHFSTNYVFGRDWERRVPYSESDEVGPLNAYGVSKLMGEELALSACPATIVIRTAALYGPAKTSRHNFLANMLGRAAAGEALRIVDDQVIAPTCTEDVARAAIGLARSGASGVFHVNGSELATWHEFAKEFLSLAGFAGRVRPATTAEIGAPASRPRYSVMSNRKAIEHGCPVPVGWREGVARIWRAAERDCAKTRQDIDVGAEGR